MLYFVNQYLMANNSSIEHAEMNRLRLFKQQGHSEDARLVLRDFLPKLDQNLKRFKLDRSQVVDMYDFFAYTTSYVGQKCHVNDLHLSTDYQITSGNNYREAFDGSRLVARINFIGGEVAMVDNVIFMMMPGISPCVKFMITVGLKRCRNIMARMVPNSWKNTTVQTGRYIWNAIMSNLPKIRRLILATS